MTNHQRMFLYVAAAVLVALNVVVYLSHKPTTCPSTKEYIIEPESTDAPRSE